MDNFRSTSTPQNSTLLTGLEFLSFVRVLSIAGFAVLLSDFPALKISRSRPVAAYHPSWCFLEFRNVLSGLC